MEKTIIITDENKKFATAWIYHAKKRHSIVDLARSIGETVAETSRRLNKIAKKRPAYGEVFERLNWPLNISTGHIYLGDYVTNQSPDNNLKKEIESQIKNLIARGQKFSRLDEKNRSTRKKFSIYIKKLQKRIKNLPLINGGSVVHGERQLTLKPGDHIFARPINGKRFSEMFLVEETTQYLIYFYKKGKDKPVIEEWFSKRDIEMGKIQELAALKHYTFKPAKKTRILRTRGHWAGVTENRNLVSVNNNWT